MAAPARAERRWYRFTPDRLVLGLHAAEGVLLLSQRLEWFAFNRHKGWTVLIAVAVVAAAAVLMLLWFLAALLFGRRFQFGVRSLLVLAVAIAIPCSWLAVEMKKAREQKEAIVSLGGWVYYDYQWDASDRWIEGAEPPEPIWLRNLFGNDWFSDATRVDLWGTGITDAGLEQLKVLTQVRYLRLYDTRITNAGAEHLKGLTELRELILNRTQVTDAGLAHLKALPQLRRLQLGNTQVTDAGLKHLKELSQLEWLNLLETEVTDAGLEHLKGLRELQLLDLDRTKVTDVGVNELRQALPKCAIFH